MIEVKFVRLRESAVVPVYATASSAAADLYACLDGAAEISGLTVAEGAVEIPAGGRAAIPTGIAIEPLYSLENDDMPPFPPHNEMRPRHRRHAFPDNCVGLVFARSGLATKSGICLANGVGVIDSDYRGELIVSLVNTSAVPFAVKTGDRIAQLAFMPVLTAKFVEAKSLNDTKRGQGGFGSTGK